jgi:hypothetical protein
MTVNEELNHLRGIAQGFMGARVVHAAVELGVFTALDGHPASAEELCGKLGLHARGANDFLDSLAALGLLDLGNGRYANTAATAAYLGDPTSDTYIGGMVEYMSSHWYWSWGKLADALLTGRSQSYQGEVPYDAIHDRMTFVPDDFRTADFPAADVVVLGHVLIDWGLDTRRMLLAKAYDALAGGGSVLIYDMLINEDRRDSAPGLLISLHMLVDQQQGGVSYSARERFGWLGEAGFRECRVQALSEPDQLISAVR